MSTPDFDRLRSRLYRLNNVYWNFNASTEKVLKPDSHVAECSWKVKNSELDFIRQKRFIFYFYIWLTWFVYSPFYLTRTRPSLAAVRKDPEAQSDKRWASQHNKVKNTKIIFFVLSSFFTNIFFFLLPYVKNP